MVAGATPLTEFFAETMNFSSLPILQAQAPAPEPAVEVDEGSPVPVAPVSQEYGDPGASTDGSDDSPLSLDE